MIGPDREKAIYRRERVETLVSVRQTVVDTETARMTACVTTGA